MSKTSSGPNLTYRSRPSGVGARRACGSKRFGNSVLDTENEIADV